MATFQEMDQLYRRHLNRSFTQADVNALGGSQGNWTRMSPQDVERVTILPSSEFETVKNQREYGKYAAPYEPALQASASSIAAKKASVGSEFGDLAKRLRETAANSEKGLTESMSRYGLLESGRTAAGIGKIQENLVSDISRADIERTIAEANLVLEGAQYETGVKRNILSDMTGAQGSQKAFDLSKFKTLTDFYADPYSVSSMPPDILAQSLSGLGYTVTK